MLPAWRTFELTVSKSARPGGHLWKHPRVILMISTGLDAFPTTDRSSCFLLLANQFNWILHDCPMSGWYDLHTVHELRLQAAPLKFWLLFHKVSTPAAKTTKLPTCTKEVTQTPNLSTA